MKYGGTCRHFLKKYMTCSWYSSLACSSVSATQICWAKPARYGLRSAPRRSAVSQNVSITFLANL